VSADISCSAPRLCTTVRAKRQAKGNEKAAVNISIIIKLLLCSANSIMLSIIFKKTRRCFCCVLEDLAQKKKLNGDCLTMLCYQLNSIRRAMKRLAYVTSVETCIIAFFHHYYC
jgi:hypothetical protein